jgi:small-conductance mechanosensitive channel
VKSEKHENKHFWRMTCLKLTPLLIFMIFGLVISSTYGGVKVGSTGHKLTIAVGVLIFIIFSVIFLNTLAKAIKITIISKDLGIGRAAAAKFILKLFGYIIIIFTALDHLGVDVGHLLLGSAVLGIILGVAAQQALENVFASIVLIVSHPFAVGEEVTIISGSLGGTYSGKVLEIGITHSRVEEKSGNIISFPNSALLNGATIREEEKNS